MARLALLARRQRSHSRRSRASSKEIQRCVANIGSAVCLRVGVPRSLGATLFKDRRTISPGYSRSCREPRRQKFRTYQYPHKYRQKKPRLIAGALVVFQENYFAPFWLPFGPVQFLAEHWLRSGTRLVPLYPHVPAGQ